MRIRSLICLFAVFVLLFGCVPALGEEEEVVEEPAVEETPAEEPEVEAEPEEEPYEEPENVVVPVAVEKTKRKKKEHLFAGCG